MGSLGLGLGAAHAHPSGTAPPRPVLFSPPGVTGPALEGTELVSDGTDAWSHDGAAASVTNREYRLMVGGVAAAGPQAAAAVRIPEDAGGQGYHFQLRVTVAEGGGAQSAWTPLATGTVGHLPVLNPPVEATLDFGGASGTIGVTVASPPAFAGYDAGHGAGFFVFDRTDLASGPVNLVPPRIVEDRVPAAGDTLTMSPGLWVQDPGNGALGPAAYQWEADTEGDGTFADIAGADSNSYALTFGEAGDNLRVRETLTDDGGSRTVTSAAVSVASGGSFTPGDLFAQGEAGAWIEVHPDHCFTDSVGGTHASVGDAVAAVADSSGNGHHLTQPTAAQRPILRQDASGAYYLEFDGTSDLLQTSAIDLSGTAQVTVFTAHRLEQSSTDYRFLAEFGSPVSTTNGSFAVLASGGGGSPAAAALSLGLNASQVAGFDYTGTANNTTYVTSFELDTTETARAAEIVARVNRTSPAQSGFDNADAGTGNFGNHVLSVGLRPSTAYGFDGRLYGLIVRGAASEPQEIADTETYLADRCGVSLP